MRSHDLHPTPEQNHLVRRLGAGGRGVVYQAVHRVLKVPHESRGPLAPPPSKSKRKGKGKVKPY